MRGWSEGNGGVVMFSNISRTMPIQFVLREDGQAILIQSDLAMMRLRYLYSQV